MAEPQPKKRRGRPPKVRQVSNGESASTAQEDEALLMAKLTKHERLPAKELAERFWNTAHELGPHHGCRVFNTPWFQLAQTDPLRQTMVTTMRALLRSEE